MQTPYTSTITMTVPLDMADIAAAIGRALDPDTGGHASWHRPILSWLDDRTPVYADSLVCSTLCTPEFRAQAEAMTTQPELLHQMCVSEYARRWPKLTPPALTDCVLFCAAVAIAPLNPPQVMP